MPAPIPARGVASSCWWCPTATASGSRPASSTPPRSQPAACTILEQLRLLALHDGRLLLTARAPAQMIARQAFLIDLNEGTVEPSEDAVSRVPEHLLLLDDGSEVELDKLGLSLGRHDLQSELDDAPGKLLGPGPLQVALDVAPRWQRDGEALVAGQQDARFDLPLLRFADVRIELQLQGEASLLLEPAGAKPAEVALGAKALAYGTCRLAHAAGESLAIERRGSALVLHSGSQQRSCDATSLPPRVGIALRAQAGARIGALKIERM